LCLSTRSTSILIEACILPYRKLRGRKWLQLSTRLFG